ncbi:MAG: hypothetical protein ABIM21_06720, partial [candidate division WOR-3 bacterium]
MMLIRSKEIESLRERLREIIVEKAFLYSEEPAFRLTSGRMSNYYINCRSVTMDPEGLYIVGNVIF